MRLGCRQERLLVVILQEGCRPWGLMDSVGRSLVKRELLTPLAPRGQPLYYVLTPEGLEIAKACAVKEALASRGRSR